MSILYLASSQAMSLFQAPPPLDVSSVDPKKGYSATLVAAEEG